MPKWWEDPVTVAAASIVGGGALGLLYLKFFRPEAEDDYVEEGDDVITTVSALTPDTLAAYTQLELLMLQRYGIALKRGQTIRTPQQQAAAVARGVSGATISWHMVGRAIDAYPIDPATGLADMQGRNVDLFRKMHVTWHELGGLGLAFRPYPDGPKRLIGTKKNGVAMKVWDGGHLEFHGPFSTAVAAWSALQSGAGGVA